MMLKAITGSRRFDRIAVGKAIFVRTTATTYDGATLIYIISCDAVLVDKVIWFDEHFSAKM